MTASWDIAQIAEAFVVAGQRAYAGEPVTQLEHALQAAWLAQQDAASDAQITAALLHDVGHLISGLGGSPSLRGIDDRHQVAALVPLAAFPTAVLEPIRLHVDAKRFLCRGDYLDALSPDSIRSLALQGGPLADDAANAFAREPFSAQAIAVRLWDDRAKVRHMVTPDLDHFLKIAERVLHASR
jgi:phosphonate degradation associated HDIG domain protein